MHVKTKMNNAARHVFLGDIMKQSGNYLPLTHREKAMVKWFLKFSFAVLFLVSSWILPGMALKSHISHVQVLEEQTAVTAPKTALTGQNLAKTAIPEARAEEYEVLESTLRTITAYNAGDPAQTDDSPCIGASMKDICKMLEEGRNVAAANFVPFGTKLRIHGEVYEVWDRMNSRYPNRVDIAMRLDEKARAIAFGSQVHEVEILK